VDMECHRGCGVSVRKDTDCVWNLRLDISATDWPQGCNMDARLNLGKQQEQNEQREHRECW